MNDSLLDQSHVETPWPYFFQEVDFETAPPQLRAAFESVLLPMYDEYVLQAYDPALRAAGASLCFLVALELVEQAAIGQRALTPLSGDESAISNHRAHIDYYFRLCNGKSKALALIKRLDEFRLKNGWSSVPLALPEGAP